MASTNHTAQPENINVEKILDCDVLVVGAATAGAAAAYYMAKAGLKVTIIEKQQLPLNSTCGKLVSPAALQELEKMSATQHPAFQTANVVDKATIYLSGKELAAGVFPQVEDMPKYALVFPRKVLDGIILDLAKAANAKVEEETRLISYMVEKNWVTVLADHKGEMRTLRARLLVGADGANSTVGRLLRGAEWASQERAVVARAYFEGVAGQASEANLYYSGNCLPGYSWLFPAGEEAANVGVGTALGCTPPAENPETLLMKLIENDEGMKLRLKNAKIVGPIEVGVLNLNDPQAPLTGDRVMLIGLAAGLVNPYNGEGIQMGLQSAKWAADTAKWCMQNSNFSMLMLNGYPRRLSYEYGGGFKVSELVLRLLRNRNFNPTWLQWIAAMGKKTKTDAQYRRLISAVLAGMIFPNEESSAQALTSTLQKFAAVAGADNYAKNGEQAAQYAAQNPIGALLWGVDAMVKATEIAASMSKHAAVTNRKNQETTQQQ